MFSVAYCGGVCVANGLGSTETNQHIFKDESVHFGFGKK